MEVNVRKKSAWMLFLLASIYMVGELGHFLIGVVSRAVARDIHYGDKGCFLLSNSSISAKQCTDRDTEDDCLNHATEDGTMPCEWNYSGLGLEYQILAGPSFIAVFTVAGIFWGIAADRVNRVYLLSAATLLFSLAIAGTAFSTQFWHLILSRMLLAAGEAGCSPLAAGLISDVFPSNHRGLAMSLFNWGIYVGYGFSYAVGNYVTDANILDQGWRASFVLSGIPGILIAIVFVLTVKDPPKVSTASTDAQNVVEDDGKSSGHEGSGNTYKVEDSTLDLKKNSEVNELDMNNDLVKGEQVTAWTICKRPVILILGLAACIRHSAGFCWGYNSALYFQHYYPDYDAGWWLTGISIGGGAAGAAIGGYVSDRLVTRLGISARAVVLAGSQFLATPFTFGLLYLSPPLAFFSLLIGYLAAEMWFGVMFAILVELVPVKLRSTALGVALFIINNVGGNLPVIVDPLSNLTNYRTAITIVYPGALLTSSILFFVCWILLRK